jgi:hypothetical protein
MAQNPERARATLGRDIASTVAHAARVIFMADFFI